MPQLGQIVSRDLVTVGSENAVVIVRWKSAWYVATWKCSCGAIESEVMQSTSPADAAELGRVNYRAHCTVAHPET